MKNSDTTYSNNEPRVALTPARSDRLRRKEVNRMAETNNTTTISKETTTPSKAETTPEKDTVLDLRIRSTKTNESTNLELSKALLDLTCKAWEAIKELFGK